MQCCKTCRWAQFELTPTGRIKRGLAGRCKYPIDSEIVASQLRAVLPAAANVFTMGMFRVRPYTTGIQPDDGTDCQVWEAIQ